MLIIKWLAGWGEKNISFFGFHAEVVGTEDRMVQRKAVTPLIWHLRWPSHLSHGSAGPKWAGGTAAAVFPSSLEPKSACHREPVYTGSCSSWNNHSTCRTAVEWGSSVSESWICISVPLVLLTCLLENASLLLSGSLCCSPAWPAHPSSSPSSPAYHSFSSAPLWTRAHPSLQPHEKAKERGRKVHSTVVLSRQQRCIQID